MEHYSNTKLRAYLKYEDGLAVLGLNRKRLFMVPDAVTELSETEKLVLDKNNLTELPASISKLKILLCSNWITTKSLNYLLRLVT